ncbi:MAG: ABC transporter substrate-binding protein [Xanthobacteraceae bacterium]
MTEANQHMEESVHAWRLVFAVASAGAISVLAGCPALHAQSARELYDQAKIERALVLYGGGPAALYEGPAREFEQRYPGITVSIISGFSNVLDRKIDDQIKDSKVEADLAILQTIQDFVRWKKEGVLSPFKPEGWDSIEQTFKDPAGAYVGVYVPAVAYAYNTDLVPPGNVPKSALDFLKPEFRGKLITCYPQDDDITLYLFHTIARRYGWEFFDKYMANQPSFIQGHLGVARSIASGENAVTLDSNPNLTLALKRAGKPTDVAFSEIDPMPIWAQTAATFKGSPHPSAARLFLTWFLSKEKQSTLDDWSPRVDVPPPAGLKPVFSYLVANGYAEFVSNADLVSDVRKRFAALVGPVRKSGGVR